MKFIIGLLIGLAAGYGLATMLTRRTSDEEDWWDEEETAAPAPTGAMPAGSGA